MRPRLAPRQHRSRPAQSAAPVTARSSRTALPAGQAGNALLHLQRTIGNQAVQRRIALQRDARGLIQRAPGDLDSRVDPQQVDAVQGRPAVKDRKVTYQEEEATAISGFGNTQSKLTIEYSVDDEGKVTVGALRPEYVVTTYTPVIGSEQFIEQFGPIMETLEGKHNGDMQSFAESSAVRNFNYGPQTLRHENMHVSIRQLALKDLLPDYLGYLKRTNALNSVREFLNATDMFLRVAWDERCEKIMPHAQIYYLDAVTMVAEYRQRAHEEPEKPTGVLDMLKEAFVP